MYSWGLYHASTWRNRAFVGIPNLMTILHCEQGCLFHSWALGTCTYCEALNVPSLLRNWPQPKSHVFIQEHKSCWRHQACQLHLCYKPHKVPSTLHLYVEAFSECLLLGLWPSLFRFITTYVFTFDPFWQISTIPFINIRHWLQK